MLSRRKEFKWSKFMPEFEPKALISWPREKPGLIFTIIKWNLNNKKLTRNNTIGRYIYLVNGYKCVVYTIGLYLRFYLN